MVLMDIAVLRHGAMMLGGACCSSRVVTVRWCGVPLALISSGHYGLRDGPALCMARFANQASKHLGLVTIAAGTAGWGIARGLQFLADLLNRVTFQVDQDQRWFF